MAAFEVDPKKVEWRVNEWSSCSSPCGGGQQFRQAFCTVAASNRPVAERMCKEHQTPILSRSCNAHSCDLDLFEFNMVVMHTERCSCGSPFAELSIHCQASSTGYLASDDLCDGELNTLCYKALTEARFPDSQPRYSECESSLCEGFHWSATPWSTCSKQCDGGQMQRNV